MLTAAKTKQKKTSSFGCRKKEKKMSSLAESLRIAKTRENEKNSRIKSTENNKTRSKHSIKNYSSADISERTIVRSKPDIKSNKNSNRRKTNNPVSAHKTEGKSIDHQTLLEEFHQSQIPDQDSPSKEMIEQRFLQDKTTQDANKVLFVSLDFLEDCQKYKKKFIKPTCIEDLKNVRKSLKNISSYHKRYLSSSEQIPKSRKGDRTHKQTTRTKNAPPTENISTKNLEEEKIQKSSENELNADVIEMQNNPPDQNINELDVPDTVIISMNESFNVKPSSEDVSTVDKKYIELLLSIANCNKTKEDVNSDETIERDYGLREKKIISGKAFFENKKKKEKTLKQPKSEPDEKNWGKTTPEENKGGIAAEEGSVLTRLVRDMTKSEVQIQHNKNNATHNRRFSEIQNEKKTAHSKPEVSENRKKRKTRNNVLKNNNEEVIEMPFPSEITKGSDVKELWRREIRNKSENSLSSRSSLTLQEKDEIQQNKNSELDSYKILRRIVEAEVKTICKKFVEDVHSTLEINTPAEKNGESDKNSAQLQNICKELRTIMNENTSEIFQMNGSKTDEEKPMRKVLRRQSLTEEKERRKKDDLLEYLNKCTELDVGVEGRQKKSPSDTVKQWSILHRLENAFLALGTPTFPSDKGKNSPISTTTRKSDLKKKVDVKANEENVYKSKKQPKKDLSGAKEKKDLVGMKEKKDLQEKVTGIGERKKLLANTEKENILKNNEKNNLLANKKKENLPGDREVKNRVSNKDKKELTRSRERKPPVPISPNEKHRNDPKDPHLPKHPPGVKSPVTPRNKSRDSESVRPVTKEKPKETKNPKNNITQPEAAITPQKITEFEDKIKQKKSKTQTQKSVVPDTKKVQQRPLARPNSNASESKSPKKDEKPQTNKNSVTPTLEKAEPEESKPKEEPEVRRPSEATITVINQTEDENLERKKTFEVIQVEVSSKIKAGKSKSCNEMDDTLEMNFLRNRFPPSRSAEHKSSNFWDISEEREYKSYGGLCKITPVTPRKMFVKGKSLRHLGRTKTVSQKDRLRGNHEQIAKSLERYINDEKKSEEVMPAEDLQVANPLEMETSTSNRVVKNRSILSIRGSQEIKFPGRQEKSVTNFSPESEPVEDLLSLPKGEGTGLQTYPTSHNDSTWQASTCTFDVKGSTDRYNSHEDNPPHETTKEAERSEDLSSFSSLSVYTSEQPDIEDDEKEYMENKKNWERDMKQYRALVKEIMSHYRRIDGFLKENEHSQSFSSDCGCSSSKETITYNKSVGHLKEINIDEYRRKILSEYEALPIFEYKSKIQERTGNTKWDERRRNLHFVKPLKTELDIDVKDFKPNVQKILDSELYVDTENLLKRNELLQKFNEKKSSLQEIELSKTEKKVGEADCLRSFSTPKTFPQLSKTTDYSSSMQSLLTRVNTNGNFGLETVLLRM